MNVLCGRSTLKNGLARMQASVHFTSADNMFSLFSAAHVYCI